MRPMDRSPGQSDLVARIAGAASPVVLLTGPAASGKTAAALELYRSVHDAAGRPRAVILAPNTAAADDNRRRLLAASDSGVVIAPRVQTFTALAQQILSQADHGAPGQAISPFQRHLMLRDILDRLHAAGELAGFDAVIDTRGIVTSVDVAIAELKRAAVDPEALAAASDPGPARQALVAVYRTYQAELHQRGAYDQEGLMWLTRAYLAGQASHAGRPVALADVDVILVDGFTDFTPTQLEILRLLAIGRQRMLITLPYVEDRRRRLWHWTRRTFLAIRETFGEHLSTLPVQPVDRPDAAPLWDALFAHDAPPVDLPDGVSVISAAGIEQEVAAAAAAIKRLLAAGAEAGRIAVVTRSLSEYAPVIERLFADTDIPVRPAAACLVDIPIIRHLLAMAAIGPDYHCETVLAVISNSYFRPQALGDFDERTVATAKALIQQANILSGRAAYANAAERFIRRAELSDVPEPDQGPSLASDTLLRSIDALRQADQMLRALFDLAGSDLLHLIGELGLARAACEQTDPGRIARDLRALAALTAALSSLDTQRPSSQLREALRAAPCPTARTESLVDVLDCLDARACRHDHVFLLGLTEGQFPRRFVDTPLLSERSRLALTQRGMGIDRRDDLTAREMLLFYLSVSRADHTLTLGTLASDAAGKPCAPSSFLTALARPVGGLDRMPTQTFPLGQLVPETDQLARHADVLARAWLDLFDPQHDAPGPPLRWAARQAPAAMARAAVGLWASQRRWRTAPCDSFDGRITDEAILADLAKRYPGETVFSASQLERFAGCPWRYFATYVLALDEPSNQQRHLDAAGRGRICHEILFELLTRLADTHGRPLTLSAVSPDEATATLKAATADVSQRNQRRFSPPYPALWQIQVDRLEDQIRRYVLACQADTVWPSASVRFELAFGMGEAAPDEVQDAASLAGPVSIDTPTGAIRLRGRIDRVDLVDTGTESALLVVDYKTGALPTKKALAEGLAVQIPLYAIAAEALLDEHCMGGVYQRIADAPASLVCASLKPKGGALQGDPDYDDILTATRESVGWMVSAMAAGRFDALPTHDCPRRCGFREICQYSKRRAALKTTEGGHT